MVLKVIVGIALLLLASHGTWGFQPSTVDAFQVVAPRYHQRVVVAQGHHPFRSSPLSYIGETCPQQRSRDQCRCSTKLYSVTQSKENDIQSMKLKEIQAELKERGVSYSDCFDRESLSKRLLEARERNDQAATTPSEKPTTNADTVVVVVEDEEDAPLDQESITAETGMKNDESNKSDKDSATKQTSNLPLEALKELRSKRVRELREECAERQIRWGSFVEKEDLVQAIWKDMQETVSFSVSGAMRPGKVADLTSEQLEQEVSGSDTPILLDIYATWCGPCKLMAPELEGAAAEFGKKVRVAKLDSDKYPETATKYNVGGLPTILVLKNGETQQRVEGALMKANLVELVEPFL